MKYITISAYWVIDEIRNGRMIYVLDRKTQTVSTLNDWNIQNVIRATESEEKNRYEFWYEKNEVNENDII